jgi:hypothetical protein
MTRIKMLQNAMFLSTLVSLLGAEAGTAPDAVADEAGGLPALAVQVNALQTTVASLQAANTSLQNALNAEIAARAAGDNTLQTALTQETAQRVASVASVQNGLNAEITNRINGDRQVEDLITNTQPEVFTSQIEFHFLSNDSGFVVASVTIPPGDYLFHAVIDVRNADNDKQGGGCRLQQVPPNTLKTPPPVFSVPSSPGPFYTLGEAPYASLEGGELGTPEMEERLTVLAHAQLTAQETWGLTCVGFKWITTGGQLVAVRVAVVQ